MTQEERLIEKSLTDARNTALQDAAQLVRSRGMVNGNGESFALAIERLIQ